MNNCIVIGNGLVTEKDYHLLVNVNDISIDKIMKPEEYETIIKLLKAINIDDGKKLQVSNECFIEKLN